MEHGVLQMNQRDLSLIYDVYLYTYTDAMGRCTQATAHGTDGSNESERWERERFLSWERSQMRATKHRETASQQPSTSTSGLLNKLQADVASMVCVDIDIEFDYFQVSEAN